MPSTEEMLEALVDANRDDYESKGNVVSSPDKFDQAFRIKKLRDEENRAGSILRAWENLTGNAPRRVQPAAKPAMSQLDYSGPLAETLIADGSWTDEQIIDMLIEADGISIDLAHRILDESKPIAAAMIARRTHRREAREKQAAGVKPSVPHLEPDDEPDTWDDLHADEDEDDLDDDAIWNQEPA